MCTTGSHLKVLKHECEFVISRHLFLFFQGDILQNLFRPKLAKIIGEDWRGTLLNPSPSPVKNNPTKKHVQLAEQLRFQAMHEYFWHKNKLIFYKKLKFSSKNESLLQICKWNYRGYKIRWNCCRRGPCPTQFPRLHSQFDLDLMGIMLRQWCFKTA